MTATERRAAERRLLRFLVRFDDEGDMRMAFTNDISRDGLFLKTRNPPPPGTDLRLLIRTAQGREERRAVVVWTRYNFAQPRDPFAASGAGVRFLEAAGTGARDN